MEQKSLTQEEIQHAEELQLLGLCQGAKEWIRLRGEEYFIGPRCDDNVASWGSAIGPLATASECIQDYLESIKPTGDLQVAFKKICTYAANQIGRFGYHGGANSAFRQARIELAKEEKCQNG